MSKKIDETLKCFFENILDHNDNGNFQIINDILCREATNKLDKSFQVVIPTKYRSAILKLAHEIPLAGHLGIRKTLKKLDKFFYWPKLKDDVKFWVSTCANCQKTAKIMQSNRALLVITSNIGEPFF